MKKFKGWGRVTRRVLRRPIPRYLKEHSYDISLMSQHGETEDFFVESRSQSELT